MDYETTPREREKMLREPDLTLEKTIQAGQNAEETRMQSKLMTKTPEAENIDSVQNRGRNSWKFKHTRNEEDKIADIKARRQKTKLDK